MAMKMGMPVAFLVSDPKLCPTTAQNIMSVFILGVKKGQKLDYIHQAIVKPIVVYVPLVMQKVEKYRT